MARRLLYFMRGNAIALLALFIALGGTTYAATKYPANIIGAKQLKKNAVTGVKIKSNAVSIIAVENNKKHTTYKVKYRITFIQPDTTPRP